MYVSSALFGAPDGPTLLVMPVIRNSPSPVLITADGVATDKASSCATVKVTPPMVTSFRPSGAVTVRLPVVVSLLVAASLPPLRPDSWTVASPVAPPLPSTGVICGAPSVWPLMVIVSVLDAERLPGSVMV